MMKRTQIYIDIPTYHRAKATSKLTGQTLSELVRVALAAHLPKRAKKRAPFLWLDDYLKKHPDPPGTPTDLSYNHDHYLYGAPKRKAGKK